MRHWAGLRAYSRVIRELPAFFRNQVSLDEAKDIIQRRLAEREENFLRLVERAVFGNPRSPYLPLLKLAGCELGDMRDMVRTKGLEDTLRALREAGVYLRFEEFKGREPIVRNGTEIAVKPRDFWNPQLGGSYEVETGGSTGRPGRLAVDLNSLAARAPIQMLCEEIQGTLGIPAAIWFGIPPSIGLSSILTRTCYGNVPQKWFTPFTSRDLRSHSLTSRIRYSLLTRGVVEMGRLRGIPIPRPELVKLDQAAVVARWAAETLERHGACAVRTHVSKALRVCLAARELGLDLTGAVIAMGGEPPTPAKVRGITMSGARFVSGYHISELGPVGMSCMEPADENDQHFLQDHLALIQYPRVVPHSEITVDAFYFTTLLPTAATVLLNVESDDYGSVESRSCGCPFEEYGFTKHIRHIRSFSKLTGEGTTLVGSHMVRILDEVLPARFGGSPLDYQLLEEEDEQGFTRLSLVVSPKVELTDESAVVEAVLNALGQRGRLWRLAGSLRVKRVEPIWTARGKLVPLHPMGRSDRRHGNASATSQRRRGVS